jgi:hypothetical protein
MKQLVLKYIAGGSLLVAIVSIIVQQQSMGWAGLIAFLYAGIFSGDLTKSSSRWLKGSSICCLIVFTILVLQYIPVYALPLIAIAVTGAAIYVSRISAWHEIYMREYANKINGEVTRKE